MKRNIITVMLLKFMISYSYALFIFISVFTGCRSSDKNEVFDSLIIEVKPPKGAGESLSFILSKYQLDFIHVGFSGGDSLAIQVNDVLIDYNELTQYIFQQVDVFDANKRHFFCLNIDRRIDTTTISRIKKQIRERQIEEVYSTVLNENEILVKKEILSP